MMGFNTLLGLKKKENNFKSFTKSIYIHNTSIANPNMHLQIRNQTLKRLKKTKSNFSRVKPKYYKPINQKYF